MVFSSFKIKTIGRVISSINKGKEMPLQGVQAKIEVFEEYESGLLEIERYTHLIIIGFLHLSDRTVLQACPRKIDPLASPKGVFAMRSPVRPNPISINAVRLIKRENRFLTVDHLDLINETPIIDIKPYVDWDCIFSARRRTLKPGTISEKFSHRDRVQDFLRQATNYHGGLCPGIVIGVLACAEIFPKYVPLDRLKSKKLIVFVESDRCIADAITAITGCALGRRSLKFKDFGKFAMVFYDQDKEVAYRVSLSSTMGKITPKTPIDEILNLSADQIFKISTVEILLSEFDLPGYPKKKVICDTCGETIRDNREIIENQVVQCKYCSGLDRYYIC